MARRADRTVAHGREGIRGGTENAVRMVVLGIDPGLANCGFGVVVRRAHRLLAADGGVIRTSSEDAPERRLAMLHDGRVVFTGTPSEAHETNNPLVKQFIEGNSEAAAGAV